MVRVAGIEPALGQGKSLVHHRLCVTPMTSFVSSNPMTVRADDFTLSDLCLEFLKTNRPSGHDSNTAGLVRQVIEVHHVVRILNATVAAWRPLSDLSDESQVAFLVLRVPLADDR